MASSTTQPKYTLNYQISKGLCHFCYAVMSEPKKILLNILDLMETMASLDCQNHPAKTLRNKFLVLANP